MYSYFRLKKEKIISLLRHSTDLFTHEHTIIAKKSVTVLEISTHHHPSWVNGKCFPVLYSYLKNLSWYHPHSKTYFWVAEL